MCQLAGTWVGEGIETLLDINNVVSIKLLKIVLEFERINNNCYKLTRNIYLFNGSLIYGPEYSLIDTNGNHKFIFYDSFGPGIDEISHDHENMSYIYNINGAIPTAEFPPTSINGVYNLKKQVN